LIELLMALAIALIVLVAATQAMIVGLQTERRLRETDIVKSRVASFERDLTNLLSQAYVSQTAGDGTTFFLGEFGEGQTGIQQGLGARGPGADTLTFTAVGERAPLSAIESEDDFETLNERFGPLGGAAEYTLSLTPFDAPDDRQGLFLREQRPSDGDLTQGGYQRVFAEQVQEIQFEFFDGAEWLTEWDTRTQNPARIPAAIRVTYRMQEDEESRILVVGLRHSDVTPENPVTVGGGA
jgi:type II secretory pathway component PulJ